MYCPRCGKENPDNAQVCANCNSLLPSMVVTVPAGPVNTSGLAIASFVLGILSFCTFCVTALPAIILGIVALAKIGKSGGRLKGNGFAVAGIVVPVVAGVFMLPVLLGITMPALARTRHMAFRMTCATNVRDLGKAMMLYANDYDDKFPTSSKWCDLLVEHQEVNRMTFRCQGATEGPCNYAMNKDAAGLGPSALHDVVLLFETSPGWNQAGGAESLTTDNHQGDGCNVLFVDGHVEFVRMQELDRLRWKPD